MPDLLKRVVIPSTDREGRRFAYGIAKTPSSDLIKIAHELRPDILAYIKRLRPNKRYQYVLYTPLGSSEFWGANSNGDYMPELALSFDRDTDDADVVAHLLAEKFLAPFGKSLPPVDHSNFGYKTFLEAHRFGFHQNKDPSIAYGTIELSVWNPKMHRIEVVAVHDREKAKEVGAGEIIESIDEGRPQAISMGLRVKFDICSRCGKISFSKDDYCEHLATMMGKLLPDGSRVVAYNLFPRFFDISDVAVPAAREAGMLLKVAGLPGAGQERYRKLWTFGSFVPPGMSKLAEKAKARSSMKKRIIAELSPDEDEEACAAEEIVNPEFVSAVRRMISEEPCLPGRVLQLLASYPLPTALSSATALGTLIRPDEFMQLRLAGMGRFGLLHELLSQGTGFEVPSLEEVQEAPLMDLPSSDLCEEIMHALEPMLDHRSMLHPMIGRRITIVITRKVPMEMNGGPFIDGCPFLKTACAAPLDQIAREYASYRRTFTERLPELVLRGEADFPELYHRHFGKFMLHEGFIKEAGFVGGYLGRLGAAAIPVYLLSAGLSQKKEGGVPLGLVESFVESHPLISSMLLFGLLNYLSKGKSYLTPASFATP